MFHKMTIIGAGMIGASIMEAAKQNHAVDVCAAWSRSIETRNLCREASFCDVVYDDLNESVRDADLIIVCVPVDKIIPLLLSCAQYMKPGVIVTDVGSTKKSICKGAEKLPAYVSFIGSHPMAGVELNGFIYGRAEILKGRLCLIADNQFDVKKDILEKLKYFWEKCGMRTYCVSPAEHDAIVANVSHLPHVVACSLSATLSEKPLAWRECGAGGLYDTTRVSAGNPIVWEAILLENKVEVLSAITLFQKKLDTIKKSLETNNVDTLYHILNTASEWRKPLSKK